MTTIDETQQTAYGFDYQTVADVMKRYMPHVLEDIAHAANALINQSGGEWLELNERKGKWADRDMEYAAYMEVARQVIGLLWQCIPPIPDDIEPPLLEPANYTQAAIDDWFDAVASENNDYRWKVAVERMEGILSDMDSVTTGNGSVGDNP